MIDIHCHVLPEIDDGSTSKQMSVEMCAIAADSKVTDIIATPHMTDLYAKQEFHDRVAVRLKYLNDKMKSENIPVRIHKGAEVYASKDILYSPDLTDLTLAGSKYLLFEFSFVNSDFDYVKEVITVIQSQSLVPVIAHPERYDFIQRDYSNINRLSDCGALFQCNLGSLTGELGKREKRLAREMINKGAVSFLASDAHRVKFRNTDLSGMLKCIEKDAKKLDMSNIEAYLNTNPALVLSGKTVPYPSPKPLQKHLF